MIKANCCTFTTSVFVSFLAVLFNQGFPKILTVPCCECFSVSPLVSLAKNRVVVRPHQQSGSSSNTAFSLFIVNPNVEISSCSCRFDFSCSMVAKGKTKNSNNNSQSMNRLVSVIGKSTSSLVSLLFFAILAYKRNATMISFFLGSIVNAFSSKLLKRIIKQQRPSSSDDDFDTSLRPSDNGMPSSHSMSLGFIGTFTILAWGKHYVFVPPILLAYMATSLYYRIQDKLHTKEQVYVGVLFGALNGFLWHQLTYGLRPFSTDSNLNYLISIKVLPTSGILPAQYLIIPAFVGLAVVGSFERHITRWAKTKQKSKTA